MKQIKKYFKKECVKVDMLNFGGINYLYLKVLQNTFTMDIEQMFLNFTTYYFEMEEVEQQTPLLIDLRNINSIDIGVRIMDLLTIIEIYAHIDNVPLKFAVENNSVITKRNQDGFAGLEDKFIALLDSDDKL